MFPLDHISKPNRIMAPFMWFGGKGRLVNKILPHIGNSKIYVEPFCGAASVFFHKQPSGIEVLNDIDQRIINLFKEIGSEELQHRLKFTLYSREEFRKALKENNNWGFFVKQNQGFGGIDVKSEGKWGRVFIQQRNMANNVNSWRRKLKTLQWGTKRLHGVKLHNTDALEIIKKYDSSTTTFYLDPPYVSDTRKSGEYQHECTDDFYKELINLIQTLKGRVVLSGYNHPIYNNLTWDKIIFTTVCYAAGKIRGSGLQGLGIVKEKVPRTEILWVNRPVEKEQISIF